MDVYIEETFDDVSDNGVGMASANWISSPVANKTADASGSLTRHATAVRARLDSYTNGGECQFHINQLEY